MIASRELIISGSSTVSTRTPCFPCQASARIGLLLFFEGLGARKDGCRDFAGFHELLEATEIAARLDGRFALKHFRNDLADNARRRVVDDRCSDGDSASAGGILGIDPSTIGNVGAFGRRSRDELAIALVGDNRIPLDALTG